MNLNTTLLISFSQSLVITNLEAHDIKLYLSGILNDNGIICKRVLTFRTISRGKSASTLSIYYEQH